MNSLLSLGGGVLAAWLFTTPVAGWLARMFPGMGQLTIWVGMVATFTAGALVVGAFAKGKNAPAAGKSGGWSLIFRPVKGTVAEWLMGAVVFLFYLTVYGKLTLRVFLRLLLWARARDPDFSEIASLLYVGLFAGLILVVFFNYWEQHLRFIARSLRWPRRILRVAGFGKGGSGAFGGLLSEWENLYAPGDILLGASSYNKRRRIGLKDDRHLLTIAATRGGKGRSAIIPNLLLWPHSAIVIDPKGTNAAVTARARGCGGGRVAESLGQDVYVLDPFAELRKQGVAVDTACFNPLADLDVNSSRIYEDILALADGIVMPNVNADPHWDTKARGIIAGMIAQVLSSEPPERCTLLQVRDNLLSRTPEEFKAIVADMMLNPMAAGLAREAAMDILRAKGSEELRNVFSTVQNNLRWLLSPPMRKVLGRSDFLMRDLKRKPTTVYLILPPEELGEHARFLRLFVTMGLRSLMKREDGEARGQKVLFLMDEFLALGRMDAVLRAMNVGASYGIKLWPIVQNVNGLANLYGENWQTFVDGAGAVQVFSIGNKISAEFLANALGHHEVQLRGDSASRQLVPVRTGPELQEETDRDWKKQIVLRSGKQALYLNRLHYDQHFPKWRYAPDPDHPPRVGKVQNLYQWAESLLQRKDS